MTKFDDDFMPSSSNPVLSIARHYDVDLNVAYNYADYLLRRHQVKSKKQIAESVWHLHAIRDFSTNTYNHFLVQNLILTHILRHRGVKR